ncbi:MAG: TonB-dependent receptor [Bacteroidales bacterium]|nr:TonB-dependent receptor [Bacteroidales bacterium]
MRKLNTWFLCALLLAVVDVAEAQVEMDGYVFGHDGEPLVGAYVNIEGTRVRTLTDLSGHYTLKVPTEYSDSTVVFNYYMYIPHNETVQEGRVDVFLALNTVQEVVDVFVNTQKRLQTSVEVPISLSVLSGENIESLNVGQIDELSGYVPGLNTIIQGQNKVGYSIRGVTSDGMESYFQPRISVFLNGVSISRMQSAVMEPFDMKRIEVVRGPQGTLFGRGAEIGAVQYITMRPENNLEAMVDVNYGGYNQRGAKGFVNTPISNKMANRFAFCYDYHDGYINNLAGGTLNGKNTIAFRNSLRFLASNTSSFNLILDYQNDDTPGVSFKSNRIAPEGGSTSPFTDAYLNGGSNLGVKRHTGGLALEYDHDLGGNFDITNVFGARGSYADEFFDADGTYLNLIDCEEKAKSFQFSDEFRLNWTNNENLNGFVGASALYEYCEHSIFINTDLGTLFPIAIAPTLKAKMKEMNLPAMVSSGVKSGIADFKTTLLSNPEFAPYESVVTPLIDEFGETVSSDVLNALNSQLDVWFDSPQYTESPDLLGDTKDIVTGILYQRLTELMEQNPMVKQLMGDVTAAQIVEKVNLDQLSMLQPYSKVPLQNIHSENQTNYAHNYESDIFADINWKFFDKFYLTLGLRGTYEKQKAGYSSTSKAMPMLGSSMIYCSTDGATIWADEDYFSWVGRLVANYMPNKYNNIYLSMSRGRRPGVLYINYLSGSLVQLQPEAIFSFEGGLKGNIFDNALSYSMAAFYYYWRHFQSSSAHTTESGAIDYAITDKGRANCMGAELSLRYYAKNVTIFGDYTYFDGKFADKDEEGNKQELAGNRFRLSPKYACDLGFEFHFPIRNKMMIYFRPNVTYKSKMYFEDTNSEDISQDEFTLLNASLGLKFSLKNMNYDFGLWGKNITNTEYIIDAGNAGQTIGFPTFVAGAPANFGVKLSVYFNPADK